MNQNIMNDSCLTTLSLLYHIPLEEATLQANRYQKLIHRFEEKFGTGKIRLFSAPGRTEIGGNHVDHQHGHVLAASVNLDMIAAVVQTNQRLIEIDSEGFAPITVNLSQLEPNPQENNSTAALVRGMAHGFFALGYDIKGFQATISSTVWKGSGLSSSAAFEVLMGNIFNALYCQGNVSPIKIAQIGQYAENIYFGKPSGLMDQMASAVGGFASIDFLNPKEPKVEQIDFDFSSCHHALCIIDTGGSHADLTQEYAAIPKEMGAIANYFGKAVLRQLSYETMVTQLPSLRKQFGDRAVLRAIHFYDETALAQSEAEALKRNDFSEFLTLVRSSGLSSALHLQNTSSSANPKEQGIPFALALCQKILGNQGAYRVHGGGFAGTVQAFVPLSLLPAFQQEIERVFGIGTCHVLSIRPVGGMELPLFL